MAKIDDFLITCNEIDRNLSTGQSILTGDVQIIYQNQHLSAEKIIINQKEKTAVLIGNVKIKNQLFEMGGQQIEINYLENNSVIIEGYVKSNNIFFTGEKILQKNSNEFFVENANYTTCSNCPATWSFDGNEINATIGGYAFLKNSFLRISGVPVFWLPYLIVPLKNQRQTGLLTPELGYIRDRRLVYSQSLFLALNRSNDLTLNFKNYEIGGLKKILDYRYAFTNKTFGQVSVSHIHDSLFSESKKYQHSTSTEDIKNRFNRWSLRGHQETQWTDYDRMTLDINYVSDLEYPKDFSDEFPNYANSGLENRLNYTARSDISTTSLSTTYYQHLLSANPLGANESAVHQLPEIKFDTSLNQIKQWPLFYKFGLNYVNFYRQKKYDNISYFNDQRYVSNNASSVPDPKNNSLSIHPIRCENQLSSDCSFSDDGEYNSNDILRTGQRLNYSLSLLTQSFSPSDFVSISPEISLNQTHYLFPIGENRYRSQNYLEFDLLSRSKLYKVYETEDNKYKHEFIPEVSYRWIPWIQHDQHPFFGSNSEGEIPVVSKNIISDSDLANDNKVQFDYSDRIYDRSLITLNLINRVVQKNNETQSYKNIFDILIRQSFDLHQALYGKNRNEPLSDLSSTMNLYLSDFTLTNQINYYPYLSSTNSTTTMTYLNALQQYFKIGYLSKQTGKPKQYDVSLAVGFVTNYLNLLTGVVIDTSENRQSDSRIKKVSLITQIKPPGECWALNFYRDQKIGSEAEWKFGFDFSWDGKPTKVIPPQELNIN